MSLKKKKNSHLIPVQVWRIYPYPDVSPPETFLVVLKGDEDRLVPISIGFPEGQYLVMAMQQVSFPRPLTHNLMQNLLEKVKGEVHQLVIHSLKEETFHAYLLIQTQDEVFYLDCRPSDGMIIATLMQIPIFLSPEVMEDAGKELGGMLDIAGLGEEVSGDVYQDGEDSGLAEVEIKDDVATEGKAEVEATDLLKSEGTEDVSELELLKAQLDRLVAQEAYEEAAQVRDQINQMQNGGASST